MSEKTNQAAVLEEADRFKDLSRCKREPVVKLPLESDSISGLKWRDTGAAVDECINLFMINCVFAVIKDPDSLLDLENDTLSEFTEEYPEAEKLAMLVECFTSASLDDFTEDLAKQLVKLTKGREIKTREVKTALTAFSLLGGDKAFAVLFKGKIFAVKHRRGLSPVFVATLRFKDTPYTELLYQTLNFSEYPSLAILEDIAAIRIILTDECLLTDKNIIKKKKLKEYQLASSVRKHTEKLVTELYQNIVQECLFVFNNLDFDEWKTFFVDDICGLRIARSLVWGFYEQSQLRQTFSVDINGNLVDNQGAAITESEFTGMLFNPVHPVEIAESEIESWRHYFSETGITQLVEQLELPIFRRDGNPLTRYLKKTEILPDSFWKRKMGRWDIEEEHGVISHFNRKISVKKEVEFNIQIETYIDRSDPYAESPFLKNIKVMGPGGQKMPDRMYSELSRELEKYFLRVH